MMQPIQDTTVNNSVRKFSLSFVLMSAIFVACLFILYFISDTVFGTKNPALDNQVFAWFDQHTNEGNTDVMQVITFFGSQKFLLPANIILVIVFMSVKRIRHFAWKIAVVAVTSTIVLFSLKELLKRERPLMPLIAKAHNYSFPSGHTFTSICFFGMICYIIYQTVHNIVLKWLLIVLIVILLFFIAASRVYLKLHFATDVIAAACLALIWLLLAWVILIRPGKPLGNV